MDGFFRTTITNGARLPPAADIAVAFAWDQSGGWGGHLQGFPATGDAV